jgi:hypothetical protein
MSRLSFHIWVRLAMLMVVGGTFAWSQQQSYSQSLSHWVLRPDGIGPVHVGMTLAELNRALQEKFTTPTEKDEQGCFYVSSARHKQVFFMIEEGRVSRIDVATRGVSNDKGLQVGDSERQVLDTYGRALKVSQNAYSEAKGDNELLVRVGRYAVQFSTSGGKVNAIRSGRFSSVQYIEGCL